jgi:hypothetical protein
MGVPQLPALALSLASNQGLQCHCRRSGLYYSHHLQVIACMLVQQCTAPEGANQPMLHSCTCRCWVSNVSIPPAYIPCFDKLSTLFAPHILALRSPEYALPSSCVAALGDSASLQECELDVKCDPEQGSHLIWGMTSLRRLTLRVTLQHTFSNAAGRGHKAV